MDSMGAESVNTTGRVTTRVLCLRDTSTNPGDIALATEFEEFAKRYPFLKNPIRRLEEKTMEHIEIGIMKVGSLESDNIIQINDNGDGYSS